MVTTRLAARAVAVLAVLAAIAAAVLWFVPSSDYLFLPDEPKAVDRLITVPRESHRDDSRATGIYMVDISERHASLLEHFFPELREGATLVPAKEFNPRGISERKLFAMSLRDMRRSQKIAAAVALRTLGYRARATPHGARVTHVFRDTPARGRFREGDIIVAAAGERVDTTGDLRQAMADVSPGERVRVVVRRDGKRMRMTVPTTSAPGPSRRAIFGIGVEPAATNIHLPLRIRIDTGRIGGPSAGLAFALDIVDELRHDLDRGRKVAATGELDLDGNVLAIGGIKQKTIGARRAGIDVFLVPDANAAGARRYAQGMRVVPVSTFREALSRLPTV